MHPRPARSTLVAVFALAILGISVSGPLARLSASPPLAIAVWRLLLSMLIVAVPLVATGSWRELRALSGGDVAIALGAGAFLALHFWSWIASLGMTSVAASVLLVNLHPVVIVAGSALWLRERPTRTQLLGIAIALLGAAVVAFAGSPTHGSMRVAGSLTHGSVRVADSLTHGSVRVAERDHALRDLTSSRTVPSGAVALGSGAGLA
ncbi:MAG TPA: DMT family transporter, partial [Gemmatimonadaceae bacterium]|nr:DMT family transporter [Gemmatimonadaceae bacterium]